jgi:hypothetical protein
MTALPAGPQKLGPDSGSLLVKTYREGVAAKVGHDLVLEVGSWEATLDGSSIELRADSGSMRVLSGERGVKPLTDKDRAEICKTIDAKVLGRRPIAFRSTAVSGPDASGGLGVDGELSIGDVTRPVSARLELSDGRLTGTIPVTQSEWGIKPYRGLMGALKVRDDVEIVVDARLEAG